MSNFLQDLQRDRQLLFDQQVEVWKKVYSDSSNWLDQVSAKVEQELKKCVLLLPHPAPQEPFEVPLRWI